LQQKEGSPSQVPNDAQSVEEKAVKVEEPHTNDQYPTANGSDVLSTAKAPKSPPQTADGPETSGAATPTASLDVKEEGDDQPDPKSDKSKQISKTTVKKARRRERERMAARTDTQAQDNSTPAALADGDSALLFFEDMEGITIAEYLQPDPVEEPLPAFITVDGLTLPRHVKLEKEDTKTKVDAGGEDGSSDESSSEESDDDDDDDRPKKDCDNIEHPLRKKGPMAFSDQLLRKGPFASARPYLSAHSRDPAANGVHTYFSDVPGPSMPTNPGAQGKKKHQQQLQNARRKDDDGEDWFDRRESRAAPSSKGKAIDFEIKNFREREDTRRQREETELKRRADDERRRRDQTTAMTVEETMTGTITMTGDDDWTTVDGAMIGITTTAAQAVERNLHLGRGSRS
ncbi:hypothetical protein M407DRAFT_21373, partial [Tulasnella calospora MUT 4182]